MRTVKLCQLGKLWQLGSASIALVAVSAASVFAQSGGRTQSAANLGIALSANRNALVVVNAVPGAAFGLRSGDQVVAVNGRKVATETAFVNRLSSNANGAASVVFVRQGRTQVVNGAAIPAASAHATVNPAVKSQPGAGGGFLNPNFMVRTSQGIMHRDVAARLGLPGTPLGSSASRPDRR